jgi:hypothetical protein
MYEMYCDESSNKAIKAIKKYDSDSDDSGVVKPHPNAPPGDSSKKKQQKAIKKYESDSEGEESPPKTCKKK